MSHQKKDIVHVKECCGIFMTIFHFPTSIILLLTTHTTQFSLSLSYALSHSCFGSYYADADVVIAHNTKKGMMVTNFQLFRYVIDLWAILIAQFQYLRFKFSIYSFKITSFHVNACLFSMKSTLFCHSTTREI